MDVYFLQSSLPSKSSASVVGRNEHFKTNIVNWPFLNLQSIYLANEGPEVVPDADETCDMVR